MKNEKVKAVVKGLVEGLIYTFLIYITLIVLNEEIMALIEYSKNNPIRVALILSPIIIIITVMFELIATFVKKKK